jgi:hypothetical protein
MVFMCIMVHIRLVRLIPSPHLLVMATSELSVHWWPAPAGVGRVLEREAIYDDVLAMFDVTWGGKYLMY